MSSNFFDEKTHYQNKHKANKETRFWNSVESQNLRFQSIYRHFEYSNASVLDVGCGAADFYSFLLNMKAEVKSYRGIDITPEFIEECRTRFPQPEHPGVEFEMSDICEADVPECDIAVCVGIFGHAQETPDLWWRRFELVVEKLFAEARQGVAVTLTSTGSAKRNDQAQYVDPKQVLEFANSRCKRFAIDHGYLDNDFLLVLKK